MLNTKKAKGKRQEAEGRSLLAKGYSLLEGWLRRRERNYQGAVTFAFCLLLLAFAFTGCRQDMHDQPKYEPLEPMNDIGSITDGRASRPLVEGTVARGSLDDDPYCARCTVGRRRSGRRRCRSAERLQQGASASGRRKCRRAGDDAVGAQVSAGTDRRQGFSNTFPFPVTVEVMNRGEERYNIFCSMCHDRTGSGSGMVVRRGYRKPPSFHEDRLRQAPAGYFFRRDNERLRRDAGLLGPDQPARPVGNRRLHPRAPTEPAG